MDWLRNDEVHVGDFCWKADSGGVRQAGRLLMMRKAKEFVATLMRKINYAKMDLVNPTINVHIIAGIAGGTGSGIFLDTCYIIRDILKGVENANIFGYLFLPDVNLSMELNNAAEAHVNENGYACLQEIDYCMSLDKNGGAFKQVYYQGKSIDWNQPPVDMCHLISAYDSAGKTVRSVYAYAMNVVSEYIMDYLTETPNVNFTLTSSLSDFKARVAKNKTKIQGYNLDYCGPGSACATFPLLQINTYLASQLFNNFAHHSWVHKPSEADVDQLAIDIFAPGAKSKTELYSRILEEVKKGDSSNDFDFYEGDYQDLLPTNNVPFIKHYMNQRAKKSGAVRTYADCLKNQKNKDSYIARMHRSLQLAICGDDKRHAKGAEFAKDLLDVSKSYSLFNIIESLRRENKEREKHEVYNQETILYPDYQKAEDDFLNQRRRDIFENDKKRFQNYENATRNEVRSLLDIEIYKEVEDLLLKFENQVKESFENFYQILARVLANLIETFKENREYLARYDKVAKKDPFYIPMMTLKDLQESMDAEVRKLNFPKTFQGFLQRMYERRDDWIEENERKISRFVTDFLTKDVFSDFANRNITAFLRDKYNNPSPERLVGLIYNDYISKIVAKANPLFPIDNTVLEAQNVEMMSHFSIPIASSEVFQATKIYVSENATEYNPIGIKASNQTDRICMVRNACAFHPGSYARLCQLERTYFTKLRMESFGRFIEEESYFKLRMESFGRYIYEGERLGKEGKLSHMKLNDWRKLPRLRSCGNNKIL